jgi:hypothetical protein
MGGDEDGNPVAGTEITIYTYVAGADPTECTENGGTFSEL